MPSFSKGWISVYPSVIEGYDSVDQLREFIVDRLYSLQNRPSIGWRGIPEFAEGEATETEPAVEEIREHSVLTARFLRDELKDEFRTVAQVFGDDALAEFSATQIYDTEFVDIMVGDLHGSLVGLVSTRRRDLRDLLQLHLVVQAASAKKSPPRFNWGPQHFRVDSDVILWLKHRKDEHGGDVGNGYRIRFFEAIEGERRHSQVLLRGRDSDEFDELKVSIAEGSHLTQAALFVGHPNHDLDFSIYNTGAAKLYTGKCTGLGAGVDRSRRNLAYLYALYFELLPSILESYHEDKPWVRYRSQFVANLKDAAAQALQ